MISAIPPDGQLMVIGPVALAVQEVMQQEELTSITA